ncbi:MAG: sugar transferase, partial [Gemmataceae bacterium]
LDIGVALVALIVFAPLMALIALAMCLESGRPVIFSQTRLGCSGRYFTMYKFRKFYRDCGTGAGPLTMTNDQRMTPLGRFLQASKLDELPQLWNILVGDMSLVGPRPETPEFADCFNREFVSLLNYKPGIFGPSQVAFRNESSLYSSKTDPHLFYREAIFPAKARLDLSYYPRRTVLMDLVWIARGTFAVLGYSGREPPENLR